MSENITWSESIEIQDLRLGMFTGMEEEEGGGDASKTGDKRKAVGLGILTTVPQVVESEMPRSLKKWHMQWGAPKYGQLCNQAAGQPASE